MLGTKTGKMNKTTFLIAETTVSKTVSLRVKSLMGVELTEGKNGKMATTEQMKLSPWAAFFQASGLVR